MNKSWKESVSLHYRKRKKNRAEEKGHLHFFNDNISQPGVSFSH